MDLQNDIRRQAEPPFPEADSNPGPISLAMVFLVPLALMNLFGIVVSIVFVKLGWGMHAMVAVIQISAIIVPTLLFYKRYNRNILRTVAPKRPGLVALFGLVFFLGGLIVSGDTFMYHLSRLVPSVFARGFQNLIDAQAAIMTISGIPMFIWYLLIPVLGAGIFEELLFRGLILTASIQRMSPRAAILLNGILFGVMHQSLVAFVYYFVLGAALAYIALRSGTLVYGIILHCALNFSALYFFRWFGSMMKLPIPDIFAVGGGLFAMAAGLWLFAMFEKNHGVFIFIKPSE